MLRAVRYGVPGGLVAAGIAMLAAGGSTATGIGIVLIGSAVIVFLFSAFLRWSVSEEAEREREASARRHFVEHGRWPDEP